MTRGKFISHAEKNGFRQGDGGHLYKTMEDRTVYRYRLGARKVWRAVKYPKGWYTWASALFRDLAVDRIGSLGGFTDLKNPTYED